MVPKKGDSLLLEHEGRHDLQSRLLSAQGSEEALTPRRLRPQDASATEAGGSRALQSRRLWRKCQVQPFWKGSHFCGCPGSSLDVFQGLSALSDLLLCARQPHTARCCQASQCPFSIHTRDPCCTEWSVLSHRGCALKDKSAALERVEEHLSNAMPAHESPETWN